MPNRPAYKAGAWYPADADRLAAEVDVCLDRAAELFGIAEPTPGTTPVAGIAPHAGLVYSGPVAATLFSLLRQAQPHIDTFLVCGACHRKRLTAPALSPDGHWQTPLGPIAIDEAAAEILLAADLAIVDPGAHDDDNAIELLTPFIKHMFPHAAIVPVAFSPSKKAEQFGATAARLLRDAQPDKTVFALASTDLTHYGAAFGIMPAGSGPAAVEWTRRNDEKFLGAVLNLDADAALATAHHDNNACGAGAAAAILGWAKETGVAQGRLLAHTNSYEIAPGGPADHMVGYGAVVFEQPIT